MNTFKAIEDVDPEVEDEQRHHQSTDSANMIISNYNLNPNPILFLEANKDIGMIPTNLGTKPDGSPQLLKCWARQKNYMEYKRARKKKPLDKEHISNYNAKSP